MTLRAYDSHELDRLALRVLDVASRLRFIAEKCRDNDVPNFELHDKKALDWIARLEQWSAATMSDLDSEIYRRKALERVAQVRRAVAGTRPRSGKTSKKNI
jgi:hypothetical protein